jgi:hypothetical protein
LVSKQNKLLVEEDKRNHVASKIIPLTDTLASGAKDFFVSSKKSFSKERRPCFAVILRASAFVGRLDSPSWLNSTQSNFLLL